MEYNQELVVDQVQTLIDDRKWVDAKKLLEELQAADIAPILADLSEEEQLLAFRILPKELAAETFVYFDNDIQETLIQAFTDRELSEVFDKLFLDDAVDIIDEMPANVVKRILQNSKPESRKTINELLQYPEDSAGSLMTVEYIALHAQMSVEQAILKIRKTGMNKETVYTCYIIDANRHLQGLVSVRDLLSSPDDAALVDIMETSVIAANTHDDKEQVANMLSKYDFLALPVVDQENRLVGIVTVDDAIDVLQEETTEDMELMAATLPSDHPYLKTNPFEMWQKRIPWLLFLMISATFTGMIISGFEEKLAASVVLTAFIPMLMDTGGNSGGQASVMVIRGLSLGEIEPRDLPKVIWKELRVGLLCGSTLAFVNAGKMLLVDRYWMGNTAVTGTVVLVVCLTLCVEVFFAKLVGCTLPIVAKVLRFDPAVMASPFITTIVDALSLLIYFSLASSLLGL